MQNMISGHTRFGGLLGSPVSHSLSPAMHNTSFQELGIDCVYLAFDVTADRLKETVSVFRQLDTYGFNLTMPCKKAVIESLDELSTEARLIGAVNTVVNQGGRLTGFNTDGIGYVESVREQGVEIRGSEITILGAGGAAMAAAVQMALDGARRIHVANRRSRSWNAARSLVDTINRETQCEADLTDLEDTTQLSRHIAASSLLTNATSVGMAPDTDAAPLRDLSCLHEGLTVSDVIYNPRQTRLMREASERGCRTFNGMYMLLYQGAEAFRIWTGEDMPTEEIKKKYFS
jgi:shikimate dehydrogenase